MANDTVGYWDVTSGMPQLDEQATRVKNQTTNTFELQGLNTTNYSAFVAGTFTPVATWQTLSGKPRATASAAARAKSST